MNYKELKRQIGKAGLTNADFSRLLNKNARTINNYKVKDDVPDLLALVAVFVADYAEREIDYVPLIKKGISRRSIKRNDRLILATSKKQTAT
jgi:hypothetical protein